MPTTAVNYFPIPWAESPDTKTAAASAIRKFPSWAKVRTSPPRCRGRTVRPRVVTPRLDILGGEVP